MGRIAAILGSLFWLSAAACQRGDTEARPSRADCQRLREHVAGLVADRLRAGADPAEVEKHQRSLATVGGEESLARCRRDQTPEQIECAVAAGNTDEVTRCLRSERDR